MLPIVTYRLNLIKIIDELIVRARKPDGKFCGKFNVDGFERGEGYIIWKIVNDMEKLIWEKGKRIVITEVSELSSEPLTDGTSDYNIQCFKIERKRVRKMRFLY